MFDVAPTELLLVAIVALLVIGPKDLPKAMRFVGHWVGKARGVARQFRAGFDTMVREAELEEMEKKWAEENARIMREHPVDPSSAPQVALPAPDEAAAGSPPGRDPVFGTTPEYAGPEHAGPDHAGDAVDTDAPVMVKKPVLVPATEAPAADANQDKAAS